LRPDDERTLTTSNPGKRGPRVFSFDTLHGNHLIHLLSSWNEVPFVDSQSTDDEEYHPPDTTPGNSILESTLCMRHSTSFAMAGLGVSISGQQMIGFVRTHLVNMPTLWTETSRTIMESHQ
jgi:hypothetical protein